MGMGGMGMNPMMMNPMMMNPMMGGPQNNFQSNQGYAVDYSKFSYIIFHADNQHSSTFPDLPCSNSCGCARMCIPMMPCHCTCPPPCPPQETTVEPPSNQYPKCENGAPDFAYPDCCYNGGRGAFCCLNGANNLHCCLNGANNPWCSLPTQPPPVGTPPGGSPPGNDCNQCHCQPCIPWIPCPPCPCRNACGK